MKKVLLITICCLCLCGCNSDYKNYESNKYDLYIDENTLASTYENNELDGNKKYFGKRIKTSSTFESVSSGTFSGLMLYMNKIYCSSFNSKDDEGKLSELNKGQSISIIGTADTWVSSKLNLKDCEILN